VKVLIFATHPIQYQVPIYIELAKQVELLVVYALKQTPKGQADAGFNVEFEWDIPLLKGYRYQYLTNYSEKPTTRNYRGIVIDNNELNALIEKERPDRAIIHGWFPYAMLKIAACCKRKHVLTFCRGDSHLLMHTPWWKKIIKALLMRRILNHFDHFLYVGKANKRFYEYYGVKPERMHPALHCINTPYFEEQFDAVLRKVPTGVINIGFAGKLIDIKRPFDLLNAVCQAKSKNRIQLILIGDGPLLEQFKTLASQLHVKVKYEGFLNQTEIVGKGYAQLDALVVPSETETWGLVVNEVMTGGIPVIASNKTGCHADLIENGNTGYVFETKDIKDLSNKIDTLINDLDNGKMRAETIRKKVSRYALSETVNDYVSAMKLAGLTSKT
jgi:glycosyltransferase involved in cell wall biosynthesis